MIYLASKSPRRRALLQQLGVEFRLLDVDVPEQPRPGEAPTEYIMRVAHDKACAGLAQLEQAVDDGVVLAADTEVVLDGEAFGKPADAADAARMLTRLSGRTHEVTSIVWLMNRLHAKSRVCTSRVTFAALDAATIDAYVATGEPMDKAGAYAIQGRAGAFVTHLEGSYSGVMGLPLYATVTLLRRFGVHAEA